LRWSVSTVVCPACLRGDCHWPWWVPRVRFLSA